MFFFTISLCTGRPQPPPLPPPAARRTDRVGYDLLAFTALLHAYERTRVRARVCIVKCRPTSCDKLFHFAVIYRIVRGTGRFRHHVHTTYTWRTVNFWFRKRQIVSVAATFSRGSMRTAVTRCGVVSVLSRPWQTRSRRADLRSVMTIIFVTIIHFRRSVFRAGKCSLRHVSSPLRLVSWTQTITTRANIRRVSKKSTRANSRGESIMIIVGRRSNVKRRNSYDGQVRLG